MKQSAHSSNYVLSPYEGTLFFDRIYLNGELSTLLKVDGYNHCEVSKETVMDMDRLYMIFSHKEKGNIESSKNTVGVYIVDPDSVNRILDFWSLKSGEQYHLHITRNTSKTGNTICVQILRCITHKEYVSSLESMKKTQEIDETDPTRNTQKRRAYKGASAGCKPGYTRHTYVLPEQMIDQVKAVAHFFCCSEVSAAEQIIQKGLDDIKVKHGEIALTLQNSKRLFE